MSKREFNKLMEGVKPLVEEYRKINMDFQSRYEKNFSETEDFECIDKPVVTMLELTNRCNLACISCYNNAGLAMNNELTTEEWVDVAHQLGRLGVFHVYLTGGEPLLFEGLLEVVSALFDEKIRTVLFSNGLIINDEILSKLEKYKPYIELVISIHGSSPETHDEIRGVKGSWAQAVNACKLTTKHSLPLTADHLVTRTNIDGLGQMIDLAFSLGASKMIVSEVVLLGRAAVNFKRIQLTNENKKSMYEIVSHRTAKYRNKMKIEVSSSPVLDLRNYFSNPCMGMLIRPNGDVKLDYLIPFFFGNVHEEKLEDIWESMKHAWRKNPQVIEFINSINSEEDIVRSPFGIPNVSPHIRIH